MKILHRSRAAGFGLVELMIAMALGLVVSAGVIVIFLAERQVYNTSSSQSLMQDTDNAISAIVTPVVRGAGFLGCGVINSGVFTYPTGASSRLAFDANSAVQGFTGKPPATLQDDASNDTKSGDWNPALDISIVNAGGAEQGSDILVLMGAAPYATPIGLPQGVVIGKPFTVNDATQLGSGAQMVAVSNCAGSAVFQVKRVKEISDFYYSSGPNGSPEYQAGSQLIPLQQTMFFVGKGNGGQSGLFEGVMTIPVGGTAASAQWKVSEIVPGVMAMKVMYGIGSNGVAAQYVDASEVSDWLQVTSVKLGFLVEGGIGSAPMPKGPTTYQLFDDTLTVPADTRMRHVYYMTMNVRNNTL